MSINRLEARIVWIIVHSSCEPGYGLGQYLETVNSSMFYLYPQIGINKVTNNFNNSDINTTQFGRNIGINFDYILDYFPRISHLVSLNVNFIKKNMEYNYNSNKINEEISSVLLSPNYMFLYNFYKNFDVFTKVGPYYEYIRKETLSAPIMINNNLINKNNYNNYDYGLNLEIGFEYLSKLSVTTFVLSYNYNRGFNDKFSNLTGIYNEAHTINLKMLLFFSEKFKRDYHKPVKEFSTYRY